MKFNNSCACCLPAFLKDPYCHSTIITRSGDLNITDFIPIKTGTYIFYTSMSAKSRTAYFGSNSSIWISDTYSIICILWLNLLSFGASSMLLVLSYLISEAPVFPILTVIKPLPVLSEAPTWYVWLILFRPFNRMFFSSREYEKL